MQRLLALKGMWCLTRTKAPARATLASGDPAADGTHDAPEDAATGAAAGACRLVTGGGGGRLADLGGRTGRRAVYT